MTAPAGIDTSGHMTPASEIIRLRAEQGLTAPDFFIQLIDTTTHKCYGIQTLTADKIDPSRIIGAWGAKTRTFTAPFYMQRGHREVRVFASKARPITCTEHLYAQV